MAASMIEIAYLKQLLEIFDSSSVQDLRIEQEGVEIRLSKNVKRDEPSHQMQTMGYAPMGMPPMQLASADTAGGNGAAEPPAPPVSDKKIHEVRSPIVGTFYLAPSPDAPNYVDVGKAVSPGMVLCIVEAMKLMNEIECDCYGKVTRIMVENAQPVEYNQVLFLIEQE